MNYLKHHLLLMILENKYYIDPFPFIRIICALGQMSPPPHHEYRVVGEVGAWRPLGCKPMA